MRTRMLNLAIALSIVMLPALASAHRSKQASADQLKLMVNEFNHAARTEFGSGGIAGITTKDLVNPRMHRRGGQTRLIFNLAGEQFLGIPNTCAALQVRKNLRVSIDSMGQSPIKISRPTIFRKPARRAYDF